MRHSSGNRYAELSAFRPRGTSCLALHGLSVLLALELLHICKSHTTAPVGEIKGAAREYNESAMRSLVKPSRFVSLAVSLRAMSSVAEWWTLWRSMEGAG